MVARYCTSTHNGCPELVQFKGQEVALVSGGFDPVHVGHIEMMLGASLYGKLVVLVNGNEFLLRKKGYVFMDEAERVKIVQSIKGVDQALIYKSDKQNIAEALRVIEPKYFINGGDRNNADSLDSEEVAVCKELNINMVFFGDKLQSSSNLIREYNDRYNLKSNST